MGQWIFFPKHYLFRNYFFAKVDIFAKIYICYAKIDIFAIVYTFAKNK
jgi:hypothetical protein